MNVLAAPFLFTMSEMEAFYAYSNFLKSCCPLYVQPTLDGVHCGIKVSERDSRGMILCFGQPRAGSEIMKLLYRPNFVCSLSFHPVSC